MEMSLLSSKRQCWEFIFFPSLMDSIEALLDKMLDLLVLKVFCLTGCVTTSSSFSIVLCVLICLWSPELNRSIAQCAVQGHGEAVVPLTGFVSLGFLPWPRGTMSRVPCNIISQHNFCWYCPYSSCHMCPDVSSYHLIFSDVFLSKTSRDYQGNAAKVLRCGLDGEIALTLAVCFSGLWIRPRL